MSKKIGEANVIEVFSDLLNTLFREIKPNGTYLKSNISGKADKVYADYFASVNAKNILIEFKEFEKEIRFETKKPLRKKFFDSVSRLRLISRDCHFIGWRLDDTDSLIIKIDNYIFKVSKFFKIDFQFIKSSERLAADFITEFIKGEIGIPVSQFKRYLQFLNQITHTNNDDGGGNTFPVIMLSYHDGNLLYNNIVAGDFLELIELIEQKEKKKYAHSTKTDTFPKKPSGKSGSGIRIYTRRIRHVKKITSKKSVILRQA